MDPIKPQTKETRYFIDLDLETMKILQWDYNERVNLVGREPANPNVVRIYITKGQYNKLLLKQEGGRK